VFRVKDLGFKLLGLTLRVQRFRLGFRVWVLRLKVMGVRFRIWGFGFRFWDKGLGYRV
jgi:hypothetical protein